MQASQVTRIKYVPRAHALDFHGRKEKSAVMVWHRRAGKTVATIADLIEKALRNPLSMPQYSYIAPTYKQAKKIAWRYLKDIGEPVIQKVMESELSVELVNGATISLFGADNPDSLRGLYHDGVVIDEYGMISPNLWGEIVAPAVADRDGWVVFIGTPAGPNHFYDLWQEALANDEWFTKMLKASQSGVFSPERLERIKNQPGMDEDTYLQEMEVDFHAANKGAYYGARINELEEAGHMGDFPFDPRLPVLTGWDLGWSDDTSIWFAQMPDKNTIHIIDFFTVSGYSIDEIVSELRTKPYSYSPFYLPHDAKAKSLQTGKSIREQLWSAGAQNIIVPSLSVQDGIQAVRATLGKCYFNTANKDVKVGLSALKSYQRQFDDVRRVYKQNPLHDWSSNPADAFRYLSLGINPFTARTGTQRLMTEKPKETVMNLENLFADRANRPNNGRI